MAKSEWNLRSRYAFGGGSVAYDVFGAGEPVVLVHGTPSSSYLWRGVVGELSSRWAVYVYDLVGYGQSEQREDQDVSLGAQGRLLAQLLNHWGLEAPAVVGHDIGGAILLRANLLQQARFRQLALIDAVSIAPWITPFSRHVKLHLTAFATMPGYIHRQVVAAHLRSAIHSTVSDAELEPYLRPWSGEGGQAAYYRHVAQFDERYTDEIEPLYSSIDVPTLILWGEEDAWLAPDIGARLQRAIPGSRLHTIAQAGHFTPVDAPDQVATALSDFFAMN